MEFLTTEADPHTSSDSEGENTESIKEQPESSSETESNSMIEIASNAKIEEEAICMYVVNGIPDNKKQKSTLYECKKIKKLKEKLVTYAQVNSVLYDSTGKKNDTDRKSSDDKPAGSGGQAAKIGSTIQSSSTTKGTHCYNCGATEHFSSDCPNKDKGPK